MINTGTATKIPLLLLGLTVVSAVQASEYSLEYGVEARYEYDDNVRLTAEDEIDISGGKLILPATLTRRTERLEASLFGEVSSAKYDDDGYNSDDQELQAQATYDLERGELSGHGGYRRTSTVDSEFTDTGRVGLFATRKEIGTAGFAGDVLITEKNGVSAGVEYSNVEYDSPEYRDYDYLSGYAGWLYQWSERTRLLVQGYADYYENQGPEGIESEGLGAQMGFESDVSEHLQLSLLAGWVSTDTTYDSNLLAERDDDSDDSLLLNGSLKYVQERYQLKAKLSSGPTPSGNGFAKTTDQLDLTYIHQLTERSRLNLGIIVGQSESLDSSIDNDRDYARARLRLNYQVALQWHVAGTYTYSVQDRARDSGSATSNALYLSLIFQPQEIKW